MFKKVFLFIFNDLKTYFIFHTYLFLYLLMFLCLGVMLDKIFELINTKVPSELKSIQVRSKCNVCAIKKFSEIGIVCTLGT